MIAFVLASASVAAGAALAGSPLGLAASDPGALFRDTRRCNAGLLQTSVDPTLMMRPQDWPKARPRKLGDLPQARAEYTVMRKVDGCMVPAPARFNFQPK